MRQHQSQHSCSFPASYPFLLPSAPPTQPGSWTGTLLSLIAVGWVFFECYWLWGSDIWIYFTFIQVPENQESYLVASHPFLLPPSEGWSMKPQFNAELHITDGTCVPLYRPFWFVSTYASCTLKALGKNYWKNEWETHMADSTSSCTSSHHCIFQHDEHWSFLRATSQTSLGRLRESEKNNACDFSERFPRNVCALVESWSPGSAGDPLSLPRGCRVHGRQKRWKKKKSISRRLGIKFGYSQV